MEALEAPAEYDGGTFCLRCSRGTDKSAYREQSTAQYAGSDTFPLRPPRSSPRADPQNKKVTMVSMHRDTEVEIEGYGLQKPERLLLRHRRPGARHQDGLPDGRRARISHYAPRSTSTASRMSSMPWAAWKWTCPWRSTTTRPADMWMRARADADRRRGAHSVPLAPLL
ncbi:MAG: hypothetical protein ACLTDR_03130 [Adlercreutzia equolifaciens]